MNLKKSFVSKGLIINDLKRHWWVIVPQLLVLLLFMPLIILQESRFIRDGLENNIHIPVELFVVMAIVTPVIISMLLYRYMHTKKSNILIHSLPIKREVIYNSHIVSGIILMILPMIINLVATLGVIVAVNAGQYISMDYIIAIHVMLLLVEIAIYMIASAVASFTGFTIAQGAFTAILAVLAVGIGQIINLNLSIWVYGVENFSSASIDGILGYFSPLVVALASLGGLSFGESYHFDAMSNVILVVYILIFYIIGVIAYKKRPTERTETLVTFKWLEPIVKYGFVFCVMLCSVVLTMYENRTYVVVMYIVGSVIAYLVAEVIINKSIDAIKNVKGYIPYALVMIIVCVCVNFDVFFYERRVPEISEIKTALINGGYYGDHSIERFTYREIENIENIRSIHEAIVNDRHRVKNYEGDEYVHEDSVHIRYNLKNGKTMTRSYTIPSEIYNEYKELYNNIYATTEYKKKEYKIFDIEPENIDMITISSNINFNFRDVFIEEEDITEMISILRDEIMRMSVDDIRSTSNSGNISIQLKQEYIDKLLKENKNYELGYKYGIESGAISIPLKKSFKTLNEYLKNKGTLEKISVKAEDVSSILVSSYDENDNYKELLIEDKKQIAQCLEVYEETNKNMSDFYECRIDTRGEGRNWFVIPKERAPEFVKEYFKNN